MRLSDRQIERYSRQILLREVGGTGQKALLAARVLVIGSGAALDTALTYLAGSGIGTLDVLRDAAPAGASAPPFAPLRSRNADVRLGEPDRARTAAPAHDLVVVLPGDAGAALETALPTGEPRTGGVALRTDARGRLGLAIVPTAAGCLACREIGSECASAPPAPGPTDVAGRASAGALAALVVCRWLLGLEPSPAARALLLDADGVSWREEPLATRTPCPRGCRQVAEPV